MDAFHAEKFGGVLDGGSDNKYLFARSATAENEWEKVREASPSQGMATVPDCTVPDFCGHAVLASDLQWGTEQTHERATAPLQHYLHLTQTLRQAMQQHFPPMLPKCDQLTVDHQIETARV